LTSVALRVVFSQLREFFGTKAFEINSTALLFDVLEGIFKSVSFVIRDIKNSTHLILLRSHSFDHILLLLRPELPQNRPNQGDSSERVLKLDLESDEVLLSTKERPVGQCSLVARHVGKCKLKCFLSSSVLLNEDFSGIFEETHDAIVNLGKALDDVPSLGLDDLFRLGDSDSLEGDSGLGLDVHELLFVLEGVESDAGSVSSGSSCSS
jgi:hypothetical protein